MQTVHVPQRGRNAPPTVVPVNCISAKVIEGDRQGSFVSKTATVDLCNTYRLDERN